MSALVCAISGSAPEEPVFCPKTGHVYDKRLIEKNIESTGKCPVTKEDITNDDLVGMKVNKAVRPRPASAASVPSMLNMLQSEWDALMTETYELKSHLDTTRKQLSHALYQHDAACRVIARLIRERDAARGQVSQLQEQLSTSRPMGDGEQAAQADAAELGLSPEMVSKMQELAKTLSKTRKKKEHPGLAPVAEVKTMKCTGSHPVHQSTAPGILCIDVHKADDSKVATGGVDGQVILFDAASEKLVQKLTGHSKKVTTVALHPTKECVLSGSQDATARIWMCTDQSNWKASYQCTHVVRRHKATVTELSVHPLGEYFCTASLDKSWALHDLGSGRCISHLQDQPAGYTCMKFHPDGLILAGGTEDKTVAVWDIKDQRTVATLSGHEGEVTAISFSENGYYLASASKDGTVKLWDLRKPLNIQTLQICDGAVNAVRFDSTGQYLAVGGDATVKIFNFETKSSLGATAELTDHSGPVMGVCFGSHAKSLASVSMDRTLRLNKIK